MITARASVVVRARSSATPATGRSVPAGSRTAAGPSPAAGCATVARGAGATGCPATAVAAAAATGATTTGTLLRGLSGPVAAGLTVSALALARATARPSGAFRPAPLCGPRPTTRLGHGATLPSNPWFTKSRELSRSSRRTREGDAGPPAARRQLPLPATIKEGHNKKEGGCSTR